jgi:hypothetical protein
LGGPGRGCREKRDPKGLKKGKENEGKNSFHYFTSSWNDWPLKSPMQAFGGDLKIFST